jgi:hypothetical protein
MIVESYANASEPRVLVAFLNYDVHVFLLSFGHHLYILRCSQQSLYDKSQHSYFLSYYVYRERRELEAEESRGL